MTDDPRAMLAEGLKDKTDEEIKELVQGFGGGDTILTTIFDGMMGAFKPDAAQDCVIGWEITEDGTTHAFALTVKDKQASYEKVAPTSARVTLGMALPDFLRLISGNLDGMQAFMQGKLKLTGDMMFAQQFQTMFAT